ncbi:hypothetical protein UO65_2315 [Actinokineospora spheciospongiae]|uniref:Glycosyltransferase subfamily 4-like N-terminal domain-containing protein n=1 Tax=Actinokineospora spheciospongiae TaxID=909613 RepID=W7IPK0_9PSEU|nr:glycosyltransferase [Actinokineospora spheciospongiae]EWC62328.1 hypothetical protein UO65_2315 [Actinokineospora spheciospongiae]
MRVLFHAPGPASHGVVRHSALVADLAAAHGVRAVASNPDVVHAQFTDGLYGPDTRAAATAFETWAATAPRPLVVTLHDVPGADPDPRRGAARAESYRRVVTACDAAVVSSRHEANKVARLGGDPVRVIDLPLPHLPTPGDRPPWAAVPTLGVLGFVYPGKGHAEAITAAARQPTRPAVVAMGAVSTGHDDLAASLHTLAADLGVRFTITGTLSDTEMASAVAAVTVPLALNRGVSASGSLLTWLAGRRKPLTAHGDYADEVAAHSPVWLYDDLDDAITAALADPTRTTLPNPPPWPDTGAAHRALYDSVHAAVPC